MSHMLWNHMWSWTTTKINSRKNWIPFRFSFFFFLHSPNRYSFNYPNFISAKRMVNLYGFFFLFKSTISFIHWPRLLFNVLLSNQWNIFNIAIYFWHEIWIKNKMEKAWKKPSKFYWEIKDREQNVKMKFMFSTNGYNGLANVNEMHMQPLI